MMQVRNYDIPEVLAQIEIDMLIDGNLMRELEGSPLSRLLSWGGPGFIWPIRRIERVRTRSVLTFAIPFIRI